LVISQYLFSLPAQVPPAAKYVVLISIDGLRPEFYKDPQWAMPALQQMAAAGVYADGVRSVFPSVTYPSHTTILTGALPARHGIYYNSPFEKEGQTGKWYWETSLIQTETLWDAARKAGLKTASVHWPVSLGAGVDYNIPEVFDIVLLLNKYNFMPMLFLG
jgi:predicted AlkP superfamily pyrophosphatase or phosphodiesterase